MAHPINENAPRIYLAGPDVFLANAHAVGEAKCQICSVRGLKGVFPLDGALDLEGLSPGEQARRISLANEELMRSCDAIIANMTPFRGVSMDSGTAFEVGFMRALGRHVFAYSNAASEYADRARAVRAGGLPAGDFDAPGVDIEDFGLCENLMIAVAVAESGQPAVLHQSPAGSTGTDLTAFRRAVDVAARHLLGETAP